MHRTILITAGVFSASSLLLVDSAIKGTALLVLATVVALILRRDSAATRHLVWLLAIVAMLVVPVLSALLPQWGVLPGWAGVPPRVSVATSPPVISYPKPAVELPRSAVVVGPELPSPTTYQRVLDQPESRPALATPAAVPTPVVRSWIDALPLAWAIGFVVLILRLFAARWMLWTSERNATVIGSSTQSAKLADDRIVAALEAVSLQLGIRRTFTVLIHQDNSIPMVWGILRCRLLLPEAARHWSAEQLRSVLLHELAHIKRRDTTAQLLTQLACALHWFNPLAWLAAWRLSVECERACDDLVLASGVRPSAYAGHLLDTVTDLSPAPWSQSCGLAMARKSSLEGRLVAVLSRRMNRRGVPVAIAVFALVIAVGIAAPIAMLRAADEKPGSYIEQGRKLLEAKDWSGARDKLSEAIAASPPDPLLHTMLGDALNHLTSIEPGNKEAAHEQWEMALGIDSGFLPAHERIIHFWKDDLDLRIRASSRAQAASKLREVADRMLKVDKSNHLANTAKGEAIVELLLDGIQLKDSLPEAQDILIAARVEDPNDADIPYALARSYLWQAQDASRSRNSILETQLYASSMTVMTDAVTARPDNAYMHYRLGQLYLQLVAAKRVGPEASVDLRELISKAAAEVDIARQLAKPDQEHYVDINLYDARLVLERPDFPEQASSTVPVGDVASTSQPAQVDRAKTAEAIYRDVLKNHPGEPVTTIALAGLIGEIPERRAEAITLLSADFVDPNPRPGIKGTLLPVYQNEAAIKLLNFKLDQFDTTRDRKEQEQLLNECDPICEKLAGKLGDTPNILVARGRLELAHHHIAEAAQLLQKSLTLLDPTDPLIQRDRYEVMYYLARALFLTQQTDDAKKLLVEIVKVYDHFVPARVLLARLLVTEHQNEQAKPHIDFLEQILPSNPALLNDVVRMRIASADGPGKDATIKRYYDLCPEKSLTQRRDKAATARLAGYPDEAIRLFLAIHAEAPGDDDAAINLAGLYLAAGQKDKALAVVKEALAANPLDDSLLKLRVQLEKAK